jgi:hypothetical protein
VLVSGITESVTSLERCNTSILKGSEGSVGPTTAVAGRRSFSYVHRYSFSESFTVLALCTVPAQSARVVLRVP